jgi:hypothetical protein
MSKSAKPYEEFKWKTCKEDEYPGLPTYINTVLFETKLKEVLEQRCKFVKKIITHRFLKKEVTLWKPDFLGDDKMKTSCVTAPQNTLNSLRKHGVDFDAEMKQDVRHAAAGTEKRLPRLCVGTITDLNNPVIRSGTRYPKGLFAEKKIEPGRVLGQYCGVAMVSADWDKKSKEDSKEDPDRAVFTFDADCEDAEQRPWPEIGKRRDVPAQRVCVHE